MLTSSRKTLPEIQSPDPFLSKQGASVENVLVSLVSMDLKSCKKMMSQILSQFSVNVWHAMVLEATALLTPQQPLPHTYENLL